MASTVVVSSLPPGTALSRYLMAKGMGGLGQIDRDAAVWRSTPQVLECLHEELRTTTKAAVVPGTTSDTTFMGPMAAYGIASEALALLRDRSIIGALEPKMRRVPLRTKVSRETGTGSGGAWIGENLTTPVAATAYDAVTVPAYKAGVIVTLSKELLKLSDPDAERTVRETIVQGLAAYLDRQFLDSTVTASANLRPAAVTVGGTAITSTGTTAAQLSADLNAMVAAITTPGSGLTWIMKKKTMATIAGALGVNSGLPQTLYGLPVVVSDHSPAAVSLVDASQILYADDGGISLDTSEYALLQSDSVPTDPPTAATVMTSLWQQNLWAIKALKWISYVPARTGIASYMAVSY